MPFRADHKSGERSRRLLVDAQAPQASRLSFVVSPLKDLNGSRGAFSFGRHNLTSPNAYAAQDLLQISSFAEEPSQFQTAGTLASFVILCEITARGAKIPQDRFSLIGPY